WMPSATASRMSAGIVVCDSFANIVVFMLLTYCAFTYSVQHILLTSLTIKQYKITINSNLFT
ncbi:hypothetical protein ACJBY5_10665, partial [Streptococcus suis]